jgi:VCBS repeat-containing protein
LNFAGKSGSHADFGSSAHGHIDSLSKGADTVTVPDAHLLFSGDYARSGADLIISDHLHRVVVPNYFSGDKHPALVSAQGAPLDPRFIDALTGHVQYAQAAGTAAAPKVVGHVVKMTGSASIVRNGVTIDVNNGDNVYQSDVVQTGSGSTLGLVMIDGTTFNLTANARLMMNDLTYDATSTSNTSLYTLVQGAATFVAGQVAKTGDMKVSTPVATMGIRGTAVVLDINAVDGTVSVSVANQRDGQVHAVQVFNARGDLIGTVTSNGSSLTLRPTASFEVIAQESNKTVAQVLTEFNAFQQLLNTYEIAKQLFPNTPFPTDGRRGDNTQQPLTKFAMGSSSPLDNAPVKNNGDSGGPKDAKGGGALDPLTVKPTGEITDPIKVTLKFGDDAPIHGEVAATSIPFVVTPSPVSRISSGPGDHFGPVMSADGQFVTYDPDGAIYLFDRQSNTTATIATPADGWVYGSPTVSSDGHTIAYQGTKAGQSYVFIYNNDPANANYQHVTQLASGGQPAISGDGSRIVIEQGAGNIGLYDQQGHELANITGASIGTTGTLWKPAISADGHIIAFWSSNSSSPGGAGQLFTYDLSTATIKSIASTATDAGNSAASFSADGHYVVYQSDTPDGHSEIYLYDLRAGQVIFHTANPDPSYNPLLSPDGHFIIFASDAKLTADDKNDVTDIYVIDVTDPSHPVYRLVSTLDDGTQGDAASNLGATISAGGQFIAFGSRASNFSTGDGPGSGDIFVVDPTSGHSAIILESRNSPATLSTSGVIELTGEHSGITLGVSDSRITASFDSHGDIQWSFSEPRSDFASLQPGQISVQNFAITLSTAGSTTEIPLKVSIYDVDQPVVSVADAAPVASPVTLAAGTEDTSYTISTAALLAGVVDIDGPSLSITAVGILSGGGSIVDNHNGTFSYTPAPNYNGPVVFSYTASDGTLSASSTATLNIASVNDAPTVTKAVTGGGAEGSGVATVNLLNFASDLDAGAVLHVANLVWTDTGSGFPAGVTLSPDGHSLLVDTNNPAYDHLAQGASFAAHFSYDVVDEHGALVHQTATVTIGGTNDAPVILQTAGLLGIGRTASTQQFFIAAMDPGSAAVTTLNNFAFDSGSWVASTLTASQSDLYVISGAGPTINGSLYDFDATTGALKSVVAAGAQFEALRAESNGTLIGIGYNFSIGKNFIATMDPHSGAVTTLNNFTFDSGFWGSSSLIVSGNDVYALSAPLPGGHGSLYDFNATTGALKSIVSLSVEFQGLRAGPNGKLIGIGQNFIASVDPVTGVVTTLNHFAFDTGAWIDSSLTVVGNDAYALSSGPTGIGSLYDFDATTGALKSFVPAGAQFDDLVAGGHGSGAVSTARMEGSGTSSVDLLQNAFDVDDGAVLHVANLVRTDGGGMPAGFTLSPDGNSMSVDTNNVAYNSLAQGQTFTAHFGYDVVDEHGASVHQTAAVTIAGTNDAPVFTTGPTTTQLSVPANGVPFSHGETLAFGPSMSSDGRLVVFGASNQIPGQENNARLGDIYLYDRLTGTYKWISDPASLANSGITPHTGETYDGLAAISLDGQYVTFRGQYQVTQPIGQPLIQSEVFLYNTSTGFTTLVPGLNGDEPSINANGSLIAATGQSLTAPNGNTFTYNDVLVSDRFGHVVTRISGDTNTSPVNTADISADGRYVTFWSTASQVEVKNIKPGGGPVDNLTFNVGAIWPAGPSTPAGPVAQVYVFDRQTETINLVSVSPTGQMGNGNSSVLTLQTSAGFIDIGDDWKSAFSADGRFIIFQSNASNLVAGDNNGATDVFLYDLQTHQVQLVSAAADGSSANGNSYRPSISPDGHHIVFASDATNLLGGDPSAPGSNGFQTYVRDIDPATGLISTGFTGFHNGDNQYGDSISRDGGIVAFGGAALAFNVNQGQAEFISAAAGTVKFSGGSISDYNPGADTLTVTVGVAHGRLSPIASSGLTIVGGLDGSQGILMFTGSIDAINHALDSGVIYTPTAAGPDAIAMTVTDGHGGTAIHTVQFDPHAPQITGVSTIGNTITFDHDQPQALLLAQGQVKFFNDSISDSSPGFNQNTDAVTVTVSVGHGTLTPVALGSGVTILGGFDGHAGTLKFAGTIAAIKQAMDSGAVYAATSGGPDTITVTVTDGHGGNATQSTQFNPLAPAIDGQLVDGQYEIFVVDRSGGTAGLVVEDTSLTGPRSDTLLTKGAFGFTDADLADTHTATVIGSPVIDTSHAPGFIIPNGGLGTFSLSLTENSGSGQVPWSFSVDNAAVQSLGKGQYVTETFAVQLADHHGGNATQNVTITIGGVNDAPAIVQAAFAVAEGGTAVLSAGDIALIDPDSTSFTFTVSGVTHGSFQTTADGTNWAAATTFTGDDVAAGHVRFVHDGGEDAPTFSIQADDGINSGSPFAGTVDFTNVNDAPAIKHASLTISQGHTVTLTTADIDFVDPDSPVVTYTVSNLSHGHFEIGSGNDAVETDTFTSADVAAGFVSFVDDGSSGAPTFSLTPNDGIIDGVPMAGVVTFSAANYTLTSSEGVIINVTPEGATSGFVFPGAGNVTTPGIPEDRIAIGYDVVGGSHVVLDNAPLLGVHQMGTITSETHISGDTTFVSTTLNAGHDVTLVQTITLGDDANFFTTTIDITNNGTADISNLRFLRNFDPDQDVQARGPFETFNDVVQKPDGAETFAIVSAKGVVSHTTVAMIGLGAEWQGSVYGLFTNTDPYAAGAFDMPVDPDGTRADKSLSLTSSLGTLTAGGGHVEVTYITTNNVATSGSNALYGTTGADTINGLGGDDLLIGLKGSDTFVFNAASGGSGHDTIADFTPGADQISLDYHAFDAAGPNDFTNWLATHATVSGSSDVLIDLNFDGSHAGVDTILLKNVPLASLSAGDFHTL